MCLQEASVVCEPVVNPQLFKCHICSTVSTAERRRDTNRCPWVTYRNELSMKLASVALLSLIPLLSLLLSPGLPL